MPPLKPLLAACLVLGLCASAFGQSPASGEDNLPDIGGEELRNILSGNTVWVIRQDMTKGDEYHLPDGRVFGFNGFEKVENGCWDVVGREVCYYYKDDYVKGRAHCWTFQRTGQNSFLLNSTSGRFRGYGAMEVGNPRNHSDNGRPWQCKRLMSEAEAPSRLAAR